MHNIRFLIFLVGKLWNSVAETFIDCTLEWGDRRCRSETVRKAWALIISYMIEKIKQGHVEEVSRIYDRLIIEFFRDDRVW